MSATGRLLCKNWSEEPAGDSWYWDHNGPEAREPGQFRPGLPETRGAGVSATPCDDKAADRLVAIELHLVFTVLMNEYIGGLFDCANNCNDLQVYWQEGLGRGVSFFLPRV